MVSIDFSDAVTSQLCNGLESAACFKLKDARPVIREVLTGSTKNDYYGLGVHA